MLKIRGLTKSFGATTALADFDLDLNAGEVVGLVGENGAGKSTLLKVLSGVHAPSSGEISFNDSPAQFRTPRAALDAGIAMVHQELNLIPTLSAEDNIFLGRELIRNGAIDRRATRNLSTTLLQSVGAKFSSDTLCEDLSIAEQQLVEIAKAISVEAKLIIFDEPTAVLSEVESAQLFEIIRELKRKQVCVVYVSHRLPEVLDLCDRIVVLRDGVKVAEPAPVSLDEGALANLMVGRPLKDIFPQKQFSEKGAALSVRGISCPPLVVDGNFTVRHGEILGIAGLIGAGRTELCEAAVGLKRALSGELSVDNFELKISNYRDAIENHLAYVSEDRKGKGLVTSMSVEDNLVLAALDRIDANADLAQKWIGKLGIKVSDPTLPITSLSGGNQQKVSIAKWLATDPAVLILDEPTRGVDVGAKVEIYRIIADQAAAGMACIVISSEISELIGLCHRIVVMRSGRMMGEVSGVEMTESNIIRLASGISEVAA